MGVRPVYRCGILADETGMGKKAILLPIVTMKMAIIIMKIVVMMMSARETSRARPCSPRRTWECLRPLGGAPMVPSWCSRVHYFVLVATGDLFILGCEVVRNCIEGCGHRVTAAINLLPSKIIVRY